MRFESGSRCERNRQIRPQDGFPGQGLKLGTSNDPATGMVLEKQSVINLRLPVPSHQGYDTASLITRTRVKDIKLKQLPAQTFMPPKSYNKVKNQSPPSFGEDSQSIVLKQPRFQLPFTLPVQSKI
jgi:hypothetical protein